MSSIKAQARGAGLLYLLVAITGSFHFYVLNTTIVSGDPSATAANIAAGGLTFRLGIFSNLVAGVAMLFLVLSLYHLFKDVDRKLARLMVVLVLAFVPVGLVNLLNHIGPLMLLGGADYLSAFTEPQLEALAMGLLRLRGAGDHVAMAFWGLWLFPFGVLVIKSGFLPKILGVLLILACFAWISESFAGIVLPDYVGVVARVAMPFYAVGEGGTLLWLVIMGAKTPEPETPTPAR